MAVNVTYGRGNFGGICGLKEIHLQTIGQRARRLASLLCGLGGQSYAGPSFIGANLYWARYCAGDPRGCPPSRAGTYRYRLPTAIIAIAHEILTATWHMLSTGELYREQGPQVISERDAENARRRAIRQLERVGHKVTLEPLAKAA